MRRPLVVLAAAGLVLAVAGSSALAAHRSQAGPLPKLATGIRPGLAPPYEVRPQSVWFTPDSTGVLGRIPNDVGAVGKRPGFLDWKTWTHAGAYGVGTLWYKSGGAVGRFQRTAMTVALSEPRDGHFVKMTISSGTFGDETWCNPPGDVVWRAPRNPGSTSCRGA